MVAADTMTNMGMQGDETYNYIRLNCRTSPLNTKGIQPLIASESIGENNSETLIILAQALSTHN